MMFHFKYFRSVVSNWWSIGHWWPVSSERLATTALDCLFYKGNIFKHSQNMKIRH